MTYGLLIDRGAYGPRGVIGDVGESPNGNIVLRVGRENHGGQGWTKTEHVVLTVEEAVELTGELTEKVGYPPLDVELLRDRAHREYEISAIMSDDDETARWHSFTRELVALCDSYMASVPA